MPDTRTHRGAHPEDAALFAADQISALRRAAADLDWLLDRGYAVRSSLALVGNRHGLTERQRLAIARSTCAEAGRFRRQQHELEPSALRDGELWIDGYNLLITIEAALGGGVILIGREGCCRDLASLHGTYRTVCETTPAIELIGGALSDYGVASCRWLLDRPVSNSGRLKEILLATAKTHGWPWDVQLEFSPDAVLVQTDALVASSDSVVLDRCTRWVNLAREIIARRIPNAHMVDLRAEQAA